MDDINGSHAKASEVCGVHGGTPCILAACLLVVCLVGLIVIGCLYR